LLAGEGGEEEGEKRGEPEGEGGVPHDDGGDEEEEEVWRGGEGECKARFWMKLKVRIYSLLLRSCSFPFLFLVTSGFGGWRCRIALVAFVPRAHRKWSARLKDCEISPIDMSIYEFFGGLLESWGLSLCTGSEIKKKRPRVPEHANLYPNKRTTLDLVKMNTISE
jgi:hypothetical protein